MPALPSLTANEIFLSKVYIAFTGRAPEYSGMYGTAEEGGFEGWAARLDRLADSMGADRAALAVAREIFLAVHGGQLADALATPAGTERLLADLCARMLGPNTSGTLGLARELAEMLSAQLANMPAPSDASPPTDRQQAGAALVVGLMLEQVDAFDNAEAGSAIQAGWSHRVAASLYALQLQKSLHAEIAPKDLARLLESVGGDMAPLLDSFAQAEQLSGARIQGQTMQAGMLLYADVNGDGHYTPATDVLGLTDAQGRYTLTDAPGPLRSLASGFDIQSGDAYLGQLSAPRGATVMNGWTTLLQAARDADLGQDAAARLHAAFGLAPDIDLLRWSPLAQAFARRDAEAFHGLLADAKLESLLAMLTVVLHSPAGAPTPDSIALASTSAARALANWLATQPAAPLDFTGVHMQDILTGILGQAGAQTPGLAWPPERVDAAATALQLVFARIDALDPTLAPNLLDVANAAHLTIAFRNNAPMLLQDPTALGLARALTRTPLRDVLPDSGLDSALIGSARDQPQPPAIALLRDTGLLPDDKLSRIAKLTATNLAPGDSLRYRIDQTGPWHETLPSLLDGRHHVEVRRIDAYGAVSDAATIDFTLDTLAPRIGQGTSQAAMSVVSLSKAVGTLEASDADTVIAWQIAGGADAKRFVLSTTGRLDFLLAPDIRHPASADGSNTYSVLVRATDRAGNFAEQSLAITVLPDSNDHEAPPAPILQLRNPAANDGYAHDATLQVDNLEDGASIEFSVDGNDWQTSLSDPGEGAHTIRARQTDRAGNTSTEGSISFIVDTSAPVFLDEKGGPSKGFLHLTLNKDTSNLAHLVLNEPVSLSLSGRDAAFFQLDEVKADLLLHPDYPGPGSKDATLLVDIVATDRAGNTTLFQVEAVSLSTTSGPGDSTGGGAKDDIIAALWQDTGLSGTDSITSDGRYIVNTTLTGTLEYSGDGGKSWSTTQPAAAEGANHIDFRIVSAEGITLSTSQLVFTLDTIAPDAPSVALKNDTGIPDDFITSSAELQVSHEAGASIEFGMETGKDFTWTRKMPTLADGSHTIHVRIIDPAGNTSPATQISFVLDSSAPTLALVSDATPRPAEVFVDEAPPAYQAIELSGTASWISLHSMSIFEMAG